LTGSRAAPGTFSTSWQAYLRRVRGSGLLLIP
jgi:hypothetical protein